MIGPGAIPNRLNRHFCLLLILAMPGSWLLASAAATAPETEAECRQQLQLMAEALGAYRQAYKGAFPATLGQLYPKYLGDPSVLQCPVASMRGNAGTSDPGLINPSDMDGRVAGYTWEMSPQNPKDWGDGRMSFSRFKELQRRSLVGAFVPVIRCSHHGENRFLNLTLDGRIYESDVYWECSFPEQLPAVRLTPGQVERAHKPMSELVLPRPPQATDAMVDLRPWYNARFDDPWVMDEPNMEQISTNQLSSLAVITNRGIVFDAAGIIQLNGRVSPAASWRGYTEQVYPRAVKSIAIKRPFRVMHLLGAVQFKDEAGTTVGTVEIHRTGSPPEKWVWRYGLDVLNYRFVPGEPEPRLESTAVAWTGSFVNTNLKEKPRLFHLRFVTSEPEKVVDHIDFIAGNGCSSPFIVAITLE